MAQQFPIQAYNDFYEDDFLLNPVAARPEQLFAANPVPVPQPIAPTPANISDPAVFQQSYTNAGQQPQAQPQPMMQTAMPVSAQDAQQLPQYTQNEFSPDEFARARSLLSQADVNPDFLFSNNRFDQLPMEKRKEVFDRIRGITPEPAAPVGDQGIPTVQPSATGDIIQQDGQQQINPTNALYNDQILNTAIESQDVNKINEIISAPNTDMGVRMAALNARNNINTAKTNMDAAKQQIATAFQDPTPKNINAITNELKKSKSEEGSWLKLAMFQVLGYRTAALDEYAKLGIGNKITSSRNASGERATLETDLLGRPLRGWDSQGNELNKEKLASFTAYSSGGGKSNLPTWGTGGETVRDKTTGALYQRQSNDQGDVRLRSLTPGQPDFAGDPNNLEDFSTTQDLIKKNAGVMADLIKKHGTNVFNAEREIDRLRPQGPLNAQERQDFRNQYSLNLQNAGLNVGGLNVQQPGQLPTQLPTQQSGQAPGIAGAAPTQQPGQAPAVPGPAPTTQGPVPPQSEAQLRQLDAQQTKASESFGRLSGEARAAFPRVKTLAQTDEREANAILNDPDFTSHVGFRVPLLGLIPGSDRKSFESKVERLKSGSFLTAYESLRGGGQIANAETAQAKAALQRIDLNLAPDEFKQAVIEYVTLTKSLVNNLASLSGNKPVYSEAETNVLNPAPLVNRGANSSGGFTLRSVR